MGKNAFVYRRKHWKAKLAALNENDKAAWFEVEKDKMYSKRESELTQLKLVCA